MTYQNARCSFLGRGLWLDCLVSTSLLFQQRLRVTRINPSLLLPQLPHGTDKLRPPAPQPRHTQAAGRQAPTSLATRGAPPFPVNATFPLAVGRLYIDVIRPAPSFSFCARRGLHTALSAWVAAPAGRFGGWWRCAHLEALMALSGCSMRALLSGPSFLGEAEGDWRVGRRRGQDGGRGARHVRDWAGWLCPQVPCRCFLRETPRCPEVSMSCRWRRRMSLSSSLPGPTWEAPTSTSRWSNISTRGRAMVDRWGGSLGCNNWPSWELMGKTGKKSRLLLFQFPSSSWPCKV